MIYDGEFMSIEFFYVDPPFSFFEFATQFGSPRPLKRILSLMRMNGCRTIIKQKKEVNEFKIKDQKKLLELGRELKNRHLYELTFFKAIITSENILEYRQDFLGFVLICCDELYDGFKRQYVLEAVVLKPLRDNEFLS